MERTLWRAAKDGDDVRVRKILLEHPDVDVNWRSREYLLRASLHIAAQNGHARVISLLLSHPKIAVNIEDLYGSIPLQITCGNDQFAAMRLLLKDSRVDRRALNDVGHSAFSLLARYGLVNSMRWWIASEREAAALERTEEEWKTLIQEAGDHDVTSLLERLRDHPEETRHEASRSSGWYVEAAAETFAIVVFLCDGLLEIAADRRELHAARFLRVARELPMELQMVLCHRAVGSMGMTIAGDRREAAFRELAARCLPLFPSSSLESGCSLQ